MNIQLIYRPELHLTLRMRYEDGEEQEEGQASPAGMFIPNSVDEGLF